MKKNRKEQLVWIGIGSILVSILVLLSFTPTVLAQSREEDISRAMRVFTDVFRFVQDNYVDEEKLDPQLLLEGSLRGLFEALDDPYSAYLNAAELDKVNADTSGEFGGIGIYIWKTDNGIEVARPIHGSPAHRAGISAGDIITAVDGVPIADLEIDEAVILIRGEPETQVTVTVKRGTARPFDVTIERDLIEIESVRSAMIPGKIGYLLILKFTSRTLDQVTEALFGFQQDGYESLILDLRSNPGGLLTSVTGVADLFFDRGRVIVTTQSRRQSESRIYEAEKRAVVPEDIPIIVLIDRYSASAAEILTGALKDTKRALILGETTYGKGSVQQIIPLEEGGFKLTTSKYYTPSGATIDDIGIEPDHLVERESLTSEEEDSYVRLRQEGYIKEFVKAHTQPTAGEIDSFILYLRSEGIDIREERIRKEIRDEVNRVNDVELVFDLQYDKALQEAVYMLRSNMVQSP